MTRPARETIFLGIPILNRLDLLEGCLDSVDYPAEIVVVNNNARDRSFRRQVNLLARERGFQVREQERNLGVAGSWNLLIALAMGWGHDLVFLGSNDTRLEPGSLAAVVEREKAPCEVTWHICGWNFFAISTAAIPKVGWFDENFYPAYKEDQDYSYRVEVLAGLRRVWLDPPYGAEHLGSQTILSDPAYYRGNAKSHGGWNLPYYSAKWGGEAGSERFRTPFDKPDKDLRWWPDPARTRARWDWHRA